MRKLEKPAVADDLINIVKDISAECSIISSYIGELDYNRLMHFPVLRERVDIHRFNAVINTGIPLSFDLGQQFDKMLKEIDVRLDEFDISKLPTARKNAEKSRSKLPSLCLSARELYVQYLAQIDALYKQFKGSMDGFIDYHSLEHLQELWNSFDISEESLISKNTTTKKHVKIALRFLDTINHYLSLYAEKKLAGEYIYCLKILNQVADEWGELRLPILREVLMVDEFSKKNIENFVGRVYEFSKDCEIRDEMLHCSSVDLSNIIKRDTSDFYEELSKIGVGGGSVHGVRGSKGSGYYYTVNAETIQKILKILYTI